MSAPESVTVYFEAELDVEMARPWDEDAAKQCVQDAIGHTGVVVTEVLFTEPE